MGKEYSNPNERGSQKPSKAFLLSCLLLIKKVLEKHSQRESLRKSGDLA